MFQTEFWQMMQREAGLNAPSIVWANESRCCKNVCVRALKVLKNGRREKKDLESAQKGYTFVHLGHPPPQSPTSLLLDRQP